MRKPMSSFMELLLGCGLLYVAVDGNIVVVAAAHSFRTYVYEKPSGSWQLSAVLTSGAGNVGNGNSVAVENGNVAVGGYSPHGMTAAGR